MIQDNAAPAADKGKLRKKIRKKVAEILKGNTDAGENVFPNASVPAWHKELAGSALILIYPRSESASEYATAPRELDRDLDLVIEIAATGPEINQILNTPLENIKTLEDILDDIAEQVENLMDVDDSLQGEADSAIYQNTEFEFDSSGGSPIGSVRITYGINYNTMSPRSTVGQSNTDKDYKDNEIKFNIGDDDNTRESTDIVVQPT